jgi:hypothetical protein
LLTYAAPGKSALRRLSFQRGVLQGSANQQRYYEL